MGASISAYYSYLNSSISRRTKQGDLYRMIKAELLNLARHCRVTADELEGDAAIGPARLRMARYRDGGFMALDPKELCLLTENLCQDVMQIVLPARNNDIVADQLLEQIKAGKREEFAPDECETLIKRLRNTVRISEAVIGHLNKHAKNPDLYDEPRINW